jgi:large subunit ribosomal protein L32
MAVPKKKTSRHRKGKRRSHHHLSLPPMSRCGRCGAAAKPHAVCDRCGYYGETQVFAEAGSEPTAT